MMKEAANGVISRYSGFLAWSALTVLSAAAATLVGGDMIGVAFCLSVCGLQSPAEMSCIGVAAERTIIAATGASRA